MDKGYFIGLQFRVKMGVAGSYHAGADGFVASKTHQYPKIKLIPRFMKVDSLPKE